MSNVDSPKSRGAPDAPRPPEPLSARLIAFYLPQFSPTPENDEWWGKGFTEWSLVSKATPRYPGHHQPRLPGELGFYDLRVPEVYERQTELAQHYGIEAFCFYHYWFAGRRMLHAMEDRLTAEPTPLMPFCFCWANENWRRNWDGQTGEILLEQTYPAGDEEAHYDALRPLFLDPRHLRVGDRPVFVVYRPEDITDPAGFVERFKARARANRDPEPFLVGARSTGQNDPTDYGFDRWTPHPDFPRPEPSRRYPRTAGQDRFIDYDSLIERSSRHAGSASRLPTVGVGFDNTARRPVGATIVRGSSPAAYATWLRKEIQALATTPPPERLVFIAAWNEWGESCYLEPDLRYGHAYLDATNRTLHDLPLDHVEHKYYEPLQPGSKFEGIADLLASHVNPGDLVIDLGAGVGSTAQLAANLGLRYRAYDASEATVELLRGRGIDAHQLDLEDGAAVQVALLPVVVQSRPVFVLLDVAEHLREPQLLLRALSELGAPSGGSLIVSVPNVAHDDVIRGLAAGRFDYTETGLLDATHLRFFDSHSIASLLESSGWRETGRRDFARSSVNGWLNTDRLWPQDSLRHHGVYIVNFVRAYVSVPSGRLDREDFLSAVSQPSGAGQVEATYPYLEPEHPLGSGFYASGLTERAIARIERSVREWAPEISSARLLAEELFRTYLGRTDVRDAVGWLDERGTLSLLRWAARNELEHMSKARAAKAMGGMDGLRTGLRASMAERLSRTADRESCDFDVAADPEVAAQLSRLYFERDDVYAAFDVTSWEGRLALLGWWNTYGVRESAENTHADDQ